MTKVYRISAITLKVQNMERSCQFYSKIPGFKIVYGGRPHDIFSTFELGGEEQTKERQSKTYVNLELAEKRKKDSRSDFGRIIFHTKNVDDLYRHMKKDEFFSNHIIFESEPADAPWGERYFHIRELNGYQLSFAQPLLKS
jgi:catechol 2,3-dioxygenase-like lactoylglutathione lyase family enzyme